jgi:hypothetical protein
VSVSLRKVRRRRASISYGFPAFAPVRERDQRDVLVLQDEVAGAIAKETQVKLTPEEQAQLRRTRRVNAEAYELYLQGRYHWNKRNLGGPVPTRNFVLVEPVELERTSRYVGCDMFEIIFSLFYSIRQGLRGHDDEADAFAHFELHSTPRYWLSVISSWPFNVRSVPTEYNSASQIGCCGSGSLSSGAAGDLPL